MCAANRNCGVPSKHRISRCHRCAAVRVCLLHVWVSEVRAGVLQQAKRGAAGGAAPAMGMPALPAEQNKSPGAAARAARQRKRKAANIPEEFDERTMRMHKRMVCKSG